MSARQAQTLEEAVPNLKHEEALRVEELGAFYVDRPDVQQKLNEMILQLELQYPAKFLLTGHRGVGKSSALARITQILNLRNSLWPVHFSIYDNLDINDLEAVDVVFFMAIKILERCREEAIPMETALAQRVGNWGSEIEVVKQVTNTLQANAEAKAELGGGLSWLTSLPIKALISVGGRIGRESTTRTSVRQKISSSFGELEGIIDDLGQAIFKATNRRLVCLVDGIDKASVEVAEKVYYKQGTQLSAPPCSLVYTFPVALQHSNDFAQVLPFFSKYFSIPNFKIQLRKGHESDAEEIERKKRGLGQLKEILTRRMKEELISPEALDALACYSGGIPRFVLRMTQNACIKAIVERVGRIERKHVDSAVAEERHVYKMLSKRQKELLREVADSKEIDTDPESGYKALLHNLSVIEYLNGEREWYDVHPVVRGIVGVPDECATA